MLLLLPKPLLASPFPLAHQVTRRLAIVVEPDPAITCNSHILIRTAGQHRDDRHLRRAHRELDG